MVKNKQHPPVRLWVYGLLAALIAIAVKNAHWGQHKIVMLYVGNCRRMLIVKSWAIIPALNLQFPHFFVILDLQIQQFQV